MHCVFVGRQIFERTNLKSGLRRFSLISFAAICLLRLSAIPLAEPPPRSDNPEAALSRIRTHVEALLSRPQPDLFARHLRSVLALSEEDVLKLQLGGVEHEERAKELEGYLSTIEAGLSGEGQSAERVEAERYAETRRINSAR